MSCIEGRRLGTKATAEPFSDDYEAFRRHNAVVGSRMLRDALFRANGYHVPGPPQPSPPKTPVFKRAKSPRKPTNKTRPIDPHIIRIMEETAMVFRVTTTALIAPGKGERLVEARHIAMYIARQATTASFPDIGFHFGGRDHTTIMYGVNKVQDRVAKVDRRTLEVLNKIHARLQRG